MDSTTQSNPMDVISAQERGRLARLAYRFCWNEADAEDALHNALVSAMHKADQLRDHSKRWSWLCRIVIQHCHLLGRQHSSQQALQQQMQGPAPDDAVRHTRLDQEELGELMKRLLHHLAQQQRTALTLKHIERMDYAQIAKIMGIGQSTARSHVRAGREALRRLILARHPEWQL